MQPCVVSSEMSSSGSSFVVVPNWPTSQALGPATKSRCARCKKLQQKAAKTHPTPPPPSLKHRNTAPHDFEEYIPFGCSMHFGFVSYLSLSSNNDKLLKQRQIHLIHFSELKQSQALKTEIDPLYTFLQAPPSIPLLGSQSRPEWVRREAAGHKAATQMRRYLSRNILTRMHAIML